MLETPQIAHTTRQDTAVIRLTIPRAEIQHVMGPAIGEVMAVAAQQGIGPAGPVFSHHLRMDPEVFDFEVGVPVTRAVTPTGRVQPGTLPAAMVARAVYQGGYEGLGEAWGRFMAWIEENGLTPAEDLWESYLTGPDAPGEPKTELVRPLG